MGNVADDLGVEILEVSVDDGEFVDITSVLVNGSFEFDPGGLDAGEHEIIVRATDSNAQASQAALRFRMNQSPTPRIKEGQPIQEGGTAFLDGTSSFDAEGPIFSAAWTFDDGTNVEGLTTTKQFPQNGDFVATLTVTDNAGSIAARSTVVNVENVGPLLEDIPPQNVVGNTPVLILPHFVDDGLLDVHSAVVDWGDGVATPATILQQAGRGSVIANHSYDSPGEYVATISLSDDVDSSTVVSFPVSVSSEDNTNTAPVLVSATDLIGQEGETLSFEAAFTDIDAADSHTAIIFWGDDTSSIGTITANADGGLITANHIYSEDGVYVIGVEVMDAAGQTDSREATANIANEPPSVDAGDDQTVNEGESLDVLATFADDGTLDTHTATIDWGDGTTALNIDPAISPLAGTHCLWRCR